MKKKVLAFITNGKEFLALRNNSEDTSHGEDFWFTVTGSVEDETLEEAVKREIKEETNLDAQEIFSLNWGSIYEWSGEECQESNYLAIVSSGDIMLNEEHTEFKWLGLDEFVNIIKWYDDKDLLKKILKLALKKKTLFNEMNFVDYRK